MADTRARKALSIMLGIGVFVVDVASKEAVLRAFTLHESWTLAPLLNLGYWLNPGAAFSFLNDAGGWQRYFFSVIAAVAILWLTTAIIFNPQLTKPTRAGFGLIAGGAAGNLYDRLRHGAVIDWIDVHWSDWHWPAFNLADCGIVLGAALVLLGSWVFANQNPRT